MATTNETMKVIANGIEQKNEPETILEGRIVRLDLPEEAAEALAEIFSMIEELEEKQTEKVAPAQNNSNGGPEDEDDFGAIYTNFYYDQANVFYKNKRCFAFLLNNEIRFIKETAWDTKEKN